jgi:predicted amidophosphoribosyltransferase
VKQETLSATAFDVARKLMDQLLDTAKYLLRADSAIIILTQGKMCRCIGHSGLQYGLSSFEWNWETSPFLPDETYFEMNPKNVDLGRLIKQFVGDPEQVYYVRQPILVHDDYAVSMHFFKLNECTAPNKSELTVLQAIAKSIMPSLENILQRLFQSQSSIAIVAGFQEMINAVNMSKEDRLIFDLKLNVLAMSESFAARYGETSATAVGRNYFDYPDLPARETIAQLYRKALETSTATSDLEVITEREGTKHSLTIRATPFRPIDYHEDLLEIVGKAPTFQKLNNPVGEARLGFSDGNFSTLDSTAHFLLETLVQRRSLRARDDVSYLTVRSWRAQIKQHQIKALKAIKKNPSAAFLKRVGVDCATEIDMLVGKQTFKFVVPIPCGHSKGGPCFSLELAKAVGFELGLPVINAFAHLRQAGSSHPKENVNRDSMRLIQAVPGSVILIDDVATSGEHLREATKLLRSSGIDVFALAWIGGDSKEGQN